VLPPALFRVPELRAGGVSNLLATVASFSMWFLFPFYVADVLGRGPMLLGVLLAAMSAAGFAGSAAGGWLADRLGDRWATFAGAAFTAVGLVCVGALGAEAAVGVVGLCALVVGFGFGFHQGGVYALTLRAAPQERAGAGSAMLAVTQTIGTVASIAILTSILSWRRAAIAPGISDADAFLAGYRWAYLLACAVAVAAGLAVVRLPPALRWGALSRRRRGEARRPEAE
jgi:MFS family permease